MSVIEVLREMRAASLRRLDAMNEAIHLAWRVQHVRVMTKRSKTGRVTLPKLDKLRITEEAWFRKRQSPDQMLGVLKTLALRSGFPLRQVAARG